MKTIYLSLLLLIPMQILAQTTNGSYECVYEYAVKTKNADTETYAAILQFNDLRAKFTDYTAFQLDSLTQTGNATEAQLKATEERIIKSVCYFDQTTFVDTEDKSLSVYGVIPPNYYSYQEKTNATAWELTGETDTICGYPCNKAVGRYGGRTWNVWYSPEIPVQFGPWKFGGLPGLIMCAQDSEGIHQFKAIMFRPGSTPIATPRMPNCIATTREKFVKAKNHFEENPIGNIPKEGITDMSVVKGDGGSSSIFINGVQLRLRTNGYVPLEIE